LRKGKGKGKACETTAPHGSADFAKGKEKERPHESETDTANAIDAWDTLSIANSNSTHSHSHDPSIPSVVVSANTPVSPSPLPRSVSTPSTSSSPSSHSRTHMPPQYLSAEWLPHTPSDTTPPIAKSPSTTEYAPAKGQTPFEKLKDHNVIWEQSLNFVVQMSIGRENNELGDCEAKLVVMQVHFFLVVVLAFPC